MPSPQNVRRLVWTAAITSITIVSSLYGAGLKTKEEIAETTRKRQESTFDEQLTALQNMRSNLTARKGILENQIRDLDAKMEEKKQRAASGKDKEQPEVRR
ncbi:hypothetical protein PEBR_27047 [Penicillium brasilianum]|uniref:Uncharacterized protein n=1 Tax=Penicillium brasilianum TaxID=104259 RepID=A0A0F7TWB5_PENBI|nr:hypothetical protein PEBR_27047 [Penicillium brasilianum]CEJ59695.1 hypothetical protein PMG11_08307 [Penicillium brasilianum]